MDSSTEFVTQLFKKSERYDLLDLIGQGGMGQVYKAIDRELDEVVALKLLKPKLSSDANVIARFKQEIKLTRRIKHKNVARIFDLGEVGGFKFISMEFIDGKSLKDVLLSGGQLPLEAALSILRQMLDGLAAAHDEGIVHRDIKPQNVMISRDLSAYVLDFGIARSLESEDLFQVGVLVGSPAYMSTEQVLRKEIDHRSDIYSLGVVLYEMLTGQPPFEARSLVAAANKHVTERAPDVRALRPDTPEWVARLILRCMEKDPAARYQSVREMIAEIDAHPVPAAAATPAPAATSGAPARAARAAAVASTLTAEPAEAVKGPDQPRALVAEADPETARAIRTKLEALGVEVQQVSDGVSAVDRSVSGRFDLILLGADLPRLDGMEATRILRNYASTRTVPIVMIVPAGRADQQSFAFDSGAADVVMKPLNAATLAMKARALLKL